MEPDQIQAIAQTCLDAAVQRDMDTVSEAIRPLFFEPGGPGNSFAWTICMVHVVTTAHRQMAPDGAEAVAVPLVGRREKDGSVTLLNPDDAPVYVGAFVRMCAAYVNDDEDMAMAVWGSLLDRDDGGKELTACMSYALSRAADTVRAHKAKLQ